MKRTLLAVGLVICALFTAGAAARAEVPSVVDQYTEQVPTPGGEQPPGSAGNPGSGEPAATGSVHSGQGAAQSGGSSPESSSGSAGTSVDASSDRSEGSAAGGPGGGGGPEGGSATSPRAPENSGGSDQGMGLLFPILLVACLLAAGGVVFIRLRGRSRSVAG